MAYLESLKNAENKSPKLLQLNYGMGGTNVQMGIFRQEIKPSYYIIFFEYLQYN